MLKIRRKHVIPFVLFMVTLFTATFAGALQRGINLLKHPYLFYKGLPFSVTLLLILGVHELGHYFISKKNGIDASLPFFIPAPTFLGTFGAFIKMKSIVPDRNTLVKVGAGGPIAGFLVAVPLVFSGLFFSKVGILTSQPGLELGSSLLFSFLTRITLGVTSSEANIYLHPIAFAGWIGLLVTALNLLPIGQLDGGHVIYGLWGRERHLLVSKLTFGGLIVLGFFWPGWHIWAVITFLLGFRHPALREEEKDLDNNHTFIALFSIAVFMLTFIPIPLR